MLEDEFKATVQTQSEYPTKIPSNFFIKIINLFTEFCSSSDKLSNKLFQIVFNTRKFIEKKSDSNGLNEMQSINHLELTKKFNDLILSDKYKRGSSAKINQIVEDQYNLFMDNYFKMAELIAIIPMENSNDDPKGAHKFIQNSSLYSNYFRYLNILLKVSSINQFLSSSTL